MKTARTVSEETFFVAYDETCTTLEELREYQRTATLGPRNRNRVNFMVQALTREVAILESVSRDSLPVLH